jgi:IclR family pca regulon transcriptional regulator
MPPRATDASVGPLERGLAVLHALAHTSDGRMRASDLAKATGLARSPVDRIATTLERLGLVRVTDRELALTPQLLAIGTAYLRGSGLPAALGPLAATLADELDESVSVAVPDGDAVRFVVQHTRRRALSVAFRIGDALPADRCAPGPLFAADWTDDEFAAWLRRTPDDFPAVPPSRTPRPAESDFRARAAEAAARGWSADDQLIEPGLVALAVPVRDGGSRVVAALSAVSHTSRHTVDQLREFALDPLRATAARMTEALAAISATPTAAAPTGDRTADAKRELGPEYLQSLARGLAVMASLGGSPGGMTLSAVAQATGLPRATARRSLLTLEQLGYVAADGRLFRPLPRVLDLGYPLLSRLSLGEIAQPHLADLVDRVHESASVAVLDGPDIRYVARAATGRIMSVNISIGTRFPAHATSMGRVLLAGLPQPDRDAWLAGRELRALTPATLTDPDRLRSALDRAASDGFALVDQELEEGLRSLAVPVRDARGRVVAAVNVSLHAARTGADRARTEILPELRTTAARITADVAAVSATQPLALD